MKCKICGAESGKYPLCKECNKKRESGEIIKCPKCQTWHYADMPCEKDTEIFGEDEEFLYELRPSLVTRTEMEYLNCIIKYLPDNCLILPQANLASFIAKTDNSRFQNELFRNVDFLITDLSYHPLAAIEINDQTHLAEDRRKRDRKVSNICEEAGIPLIKFWTSYGVNPEYIEKRITETLSSLPARRVHHFVRDSAESTAAQPQTFGSQTFRSQTHEAQTYGAQTYEPQTYEPQSGKKKGCYIATCVYGSYDCPQVWTLRRFRDDCLGKHWFGRIFIAVYYAVSPVLVKVLGDKKSFQSFGKKWLDSLVLRLQNRGFEDTPYSDPK